MTILALRKTLEEAARGHTAVGHFNFSELVVLKGIVAAARDYNLPVIVGVSEGEREFIGVRQAVVLVQSMREEYDMPIYLNADHTHSPEKAIEAARLGFNMIVFDASTKSFDENAEITARVVETVKRINPDIIVEGEIGFIGEGSGIHEAVAQNLSSLTLPEEARLFVEKTAVDALSPAVGAMHGLLKSRIDKHEHQHLDINRIADIRAATGAFLTLHGGSGSQPEEIKRAIAAGINVVHISTELRVACRRGLEKAFTDQPDEVNTSRLATSAYEAVKKVAGGWLRKFFKY